MQYRALGRTGIQVSAISFGAGPVSGLMSGDDHEAQAATVEAAIKSGINWFDTAPGYGAGSSEANLGRALSSLSARKTIHVATKVRIPLDLTEPIRDIVQRSVDESLQRLSVSRITLLQLHNGITRCRGDEPNSITPADILQSGGVADSFRELCDEGLVGHIGLTGTGQPDAMREVIRSGRFDTVQTPNNLLNPTAGSTAQPAEGDTDYGNILADCADRNLGVFAIRVFAAGALLAQPPSAHTLKTPYFPLALYLRDSERAAQMLAGADPTTAAKSAVQFVLAHPAMSSAIIGFGSPDQVVQVADFVK